MMNAIEGRVIFMCNNCGCRRRDCNRFWDDLMFGRCRRRDCDDCGCRRKRDCDCDDVAVAIVNVTTMMINVVSGNILKRVL